MNRIFACKRIMPVLAVITCITAIGCVTVTLVADYEVPIDIGVQPDESEFMTPADVELLTTSDNEDQITQLAAKWLDSRRGFFPLHVDLPAEQLVEWYNEGIPKGFTTDFRERLPRDVASAFAEVPPDALARIIVQLQDHPIEDADGQPLIDVRTGEPMIAADRSNFVHALLQLERTERRLMRACMDIEIGAPVESPGPRPAAAPQALCDLARQVCHERGRLAADVTAKLAAGPQYYEVHVRSYVQGQGSETHGCQVWYVQHFWAETVYRKDKALRFSPLTSRRSTARLAAGLWVFWVVRGDLKGPDAPIEISRDVPDLSLQEKTP